MRGRDVIPGCTQTGSKAPKQWVQEVAPTHLEKGKGCRVWDVDGNEYVDYPMALGPVILGHNYPAVREAVARQLQDGTMFSMPHPLQVEVAELIVDSVPCAEMVRFGKNGNDATTLAAKLARAHTDRNVIATQGYHGWPDIWTAATEMDRGVPDAVGRMTESFEYDNIESLETIFEDNPGEVAAVVTTPMNLQKPTDDFLERVRELAREEGALLVFDEVLTGFRYALGGAQEYFDVEPDIACFAKGMANGFPISAIAGREDVMRLLERDDVYFSETYAGEAMSLAAAKACIETIREEDVVDHLWRQGETLIEGYNDIAAEFGLSDYTTCEGFGPRSSIQFYDTDGEMNRLAKSLFMQECLQRGILFSGSQLPSYSHDDETVEHTLAVYREAMAELADAIDAGDIESRLNGPPAGTTLRQRTGEHD
ncbi:aminotransferase class III-fold pyridoxal phosphate-dependent enzyme [Halorussus salinisoli]|uniref:aminotransferase class III-fold pyridoxal phosphate-dependent enzyme n=1 Tax=Halorussus salinisoli TaxID=2558242 RepID=UPI001485BAA6|nr:aminotransferase class III-fold pyridoxal phosphate-dependent enzyme [Halorussus salinisoli]